MKTYHQPHFKPFLFPLVLLQFIYLRFFLSWKSYIWKLTLIEISVFVEQSVLSHYSVLQLFLHSKRFLPPHEVCHVCLGGCFYCRFLNSVICVWMRLIVSLFSTDKACNLTCALSVDLSSCLAINHSFHYTCSSRQLAHNCAQSPTSVNLQIWASLSCKS